MVDTSRTGSGGESTQGRKFGKPVENWRRVMEEELQNERNIICTTAKKTTSNRVCWRSIVNALCNTWSVKQPLARQNGRVGELVKENQQSKIFKLKRLKSDYKITVEPPYYHDQVSIKFLLIISVHYNTYRSWESRKRSPKRKRLDVNV